MVVLRGRNIEGLAVERSNRMVDHHGGGIESIVAIKAFVQIAHNTAAEVTFRGIGTRDKGINVTDGLGVVFGQVVDCNLVALAPLHLVAIIEVDISSIAIDVILFKRRHVRLN